MLSTLDHFGGILLSIFFLISCSEDTVLDNDGATMSFSDLSGHQSMAYNDDKLFFISQKDQELLCDIYSVSSGDFLERILLPYGDNAIPHGNSACFSNLFYTTESIAPLLYISSWNHQRLAFVYDCKLEHGHYKMSLIQVIDPSMVSEDIIGGGYLDWVVDVDNGYLYSVAYHLKETSLIIKDNYTHITKFILPSTSQQEVYLNDSDVIDHFIVPVMTVFQDKAFSDNHIFVIAGMNDEWGEAPPRLFDIDLNNKQSSVFPVSITGEPEGLCFINNQKWMSIYGSSTIYNLDNLLML